MRSLRILAALVALLLVVVAGSRDLRAQPAADTDLSIVSCEGGPDPEAILEKLLAGAPDDVANLVNIGTMNADDSRALQDTTGELYAKFHGLHNLFIQVKPAPDGSTGRDYTYFFVQRPESGALSITVTNSTGRCECAFGAAHPGDPVVMKMRNTYIADGMYDADRLGQCFIAMGIALSSQVDGDESTGQ